MSVGRMDWRKLPSKTGAEEQRVEEIEKRRAYYDGAQYDEVNENARDAAAGEGRPFPEHDRLHAYSTQIAESVDFIANQLTAGFRIKADDPDVQAVIDKVVENTDLLDPGVGEDESLSVDDVLTDAAVAGDVPVEILWNPVEQTCYWEFWPAEHVEFEVSRGQVPERVIRRDTIEVDDLQGDQWVRKQVEERVEYVRDVNDQGQTDVRRSVFHDEDTDPVEVAWLGVPDIPWRLLRIDKRGLRGFRGSSLITPNAMESADRYNAVEQCSFLIARHNSHATLAVAGDQALVTMEDKKIRKDVADVLKFPGGTSIEVVELPTDAQMIVHQRGVLADAMYAAFGLTRVEPDTLNGLGGVSGYALEILNRKSEGTFKRIRRMFRRDFMRLIDATLQVTAWKTAPEVEVVDEETGIEYDTAAFWDVELDDVFPNRTVDVRMGTAWIVDDVQVRDDFTAELISQEEALRKRGYSDAQIEQILAEQRANPGPPVLNPEVGEAGRPFTSTAR